MSKNEFKNKKPLTKMQLNKAKFGGVYIVNDKEVFNRKGTEKARRVVLLSKRRNGVVIAPVRKRNPSSMEVSRFDGNRCVRLDKSVLVTKNKVYPKYRFKGTQNDFLTKSEKVSLKKKYLSYK